jgi:hypothetical protein
VKVPVGSPAYMESCAQKRLQKLEALCEELPKLPQKHASLYILSNSCNFSRMAYLTRTTPREPIATALRAFDSIIRQTFEEITNARLTEDQWAQAVLPLSKGGLGFRSAFDHADAAYVTSRSATHSFCVAIAQTHTWEATEGGSYLQQAIDRLNVQGATYPKADTPSIATQQRVSMEIDSRKVEYITNNSDEYGKAHLKAQMSGAAEWMRAIPDRGLDTLLSNRDISYAIRSRLGVDVYDRVSRCPFCNGVQDKKGIHPLGCMAGGDATLRHNEQRDMAFEHARAGRMRPVKEAQNLLSRPPGATEPCRRRPADILIPNWPEVTSEGTLRGHQAALDFAVINCLGPSHLADTANGSGLDAAIKYAQSKRDFDDTANRLESEGVVLKPIVRTAQGAWEPNAAKTMEILHRAVARETGITLRKVRNDFRVKTAVALVRANARATRRRDPDGEEAAIRGAGTSSSRVQKALETALTLETSVANTSDDTLALDIAGINLGMPASQDVMMSGDYAALNRGRQPR